MTLDALRDFYVDIVDLREGFRAPFKRFGYWLYAGTKEFEEPTTLEPASATVFNSHIPAA
ncbi:hypothetical protein WT01_33675 [Burkholderia cepacia]|nr:hypothetical protein WT01_33675 [Burkholderia cepacia]